MLQLVQDKGAVGRRRRDDPEAARRDDARARGRRSSSTCGRSCWRTRPRRSPAPIRALMTRPDSTPLLATIHVPTLIVVGDEDTVTPPAAVGRDAPRASPAPSWCVFRGAGHLSNLEQPESFNAALAALPRPSGIVEDARSCALLHACLASCWSLLRRRDRRSRRSRRRRRATQDVRSAARSLRPRRRRLLPRAQSRSARSSTASSPSWRRRRSTSCRATSRSRSG